MNIKVYSLSIIVLSLLTLFSSCNDYRVSPDQSEYFTKFYGGPGKDNGQTIRNTPDGGFVIAGTIENSTLGHEQAYIAKLDSKGELQWQKTLGDTTTFGTSVNLLSSGGYILCGYVMNSTDSDIVLYKFDKNGTLLASQIYNDPTYEKVFDVIEIVNGSEAGNFLLAGGDSSSGSNVVTGAIYTVDNNLTLGSFNESTTTLIDSYISKIKFNENDNEFYAIGTATVSPFSKSIMIMRVATNGNGIGAPSDNDIDLPGVQIANDLVFVDEAIYVVGTNLNIENSLIIYGFTDNTDLSTITKYQLTYLPNTRGRSIVVDGNKLVMGVTVSEGGSTDKGIIQTKLSKPDELVNYTTIGSTGNESTNHMVKDGDGYVLIGNTSVEDLNTMIEVVKVKSDGTQKPD